MGQVANGALLRILGKQVSTLVNTGKCDLRFLLTTLKNEGLISLNEYEELMVETYTISLLFQRGEN